MVRRTNSRTPNEWARMTHMPVQGICRLYGEEHEKQMSFVNICMWHELYHVHPNVLIFIIRSDHTIIKSITLFFGGSRGKTKSQWCPYIQSRSGFYGIRNARAASSAPASSTHGKRTYRIETHANKIGINPWDRQNKYDSDYLGTCPTLRNIYFGTGQRSPAEIHWFIDLIFIRMCQRTCYVSENLCKHIPIQPIKFTMNVTRDLAMNPIRDDVSLA